MNGNEIKLTLPVPISVNGAYAGTTQRYKSSEYCDWEELASIKWLDQKNYEIEGDEWLEVTYKYYMNIYNQDGSKKVIDVANYEKVLSDFLAKKQKYTKTERLPGFQDHKIKLIHLEKNQSDRDEVEIIIKEIPGT